MNSSRLPSKGVYNPKNREKYIGDHTPVYRSSWEQRMMYYFDNNPNILRWGSECIAVPYISPKDGKMHRYFVDFYAEVLTKDNTRVKLLIEVKPYKKQYPPKTTNRSRKTILTETLEYYVNQAKWNSAKAYASRNGMEWCIYTEEDIKNHC
mgnify:CR=1 FL=1